MIKRLIPLFFLIASSCFGQVQNPWFDTPAMLVPGNWEQGNIPGWTIVGPAGVWLPYTTGGSVLDSGGHQTAFLQPVNVATISQDVGVLSGAWTLTVAIGRRSDIYGWGLPATAYIEVKSAGVDVCDLNIVTDTITPGTMQDFSCTVFLSGGDTVISIGQGGAGQLDVTNVRLIPAITAEMQFTYDDGSAVAGTATLYQCMQAACTQLDAGSLDSTGTVATGKVLDPTQSYKLTLKGDAFSLEEVSVPMPATMNASILMTLATNKIVVTLHRGDNSLLFAKLVAR